MTDRIRQQLQSSLGGQYDIERELGGGGMSRTYVATERALDRRVVVKILAPELLANISVERFKREVLTAARLQHPHVVPVLSAGDADGLPWFTMPYVEGESLRTRLTRGALSLGEAIAILRDVARALEFAHSHQIVHRDIKPDNVLLAGSSATVTDFGIAKAITASRTDGAGAPALTATGQSIGTPAYMAPEQAAGDPHADPRSDIYSYGAMAYEMLTGRPPFVGATAAKLVTAHFTEQPRPVSELRPDLPQSLADLVMRCLEKDVSRRPQSAHEIVRVVDAAATSGPAERAPAVLLGGHIRLGRALGLWAAALVIVGITAWAASEVVGLPDWVLPGSLGVMLAGLPVIAFTWYVQRTVRQVYTATPPAPGTTQTHGALATLAVKASPHISWRRTWLGGAVAVGTFSALVIGFMVMRALGVGPAASLLAAGKLSHNEGLVVADFRAPANDSTLGSTVAEALRTDLGQSTTLRVMTRASMREVLRLMQRPPESAVDFALAREVATREGAKAVLDGELVSLGGSYVISARLVSAIDGSELATFRRTAATETDLVETLGRLSRDVRGKVGESFKRIRETKALERVTTSSLVALRKYVDGIRLADELGATDRGLAALEEAVALDTAFAMAWRKIATILNNLGTDRARGLDAATRAYRHRERLSETERLLTEAYYYTNGPQPDLDKALQSYDALIEADPLNAPAMNNSGVVLTVKRDYAKAAQRYRRASEESRPFGASFNNLIQTQVRLGDVAGAESTLIRFRQRLPENEALWEGEWYVHWGAQRLDAADSIARFTFRNARRVQQSLRAGERLAAVALLRGKVRDALRWTGEAHLAVMRGGTASDRPLRAAIDSAFVIAMQLRDGDAARALVRRALQQHPVTEIPLVARPWDELGELAATLRDAPLAQETLAGFERDLPDLPLWSREGHRARMRAWVAMAEGRHDAAIADLYEADRQHTIDMRLALARIAELFDMAGRADSASRYYERFLSTHDPIGMNDAAFRATALRRAGELAQARGDLAQAEAHYAEFVQLLENADAELQPAVRDVRERLARLRRQRG